MNLEEENKEKRKDIPLTTEEWLTFFFFPFQSNKGLLDTNTFNKTEEKRFDGFGFDKKNEQASQARTLGILSYAIVFMVILIILNW
ncbi:hypothetical protein HNV10_10715 [Winogradskyella litoriviva]|uniref:Uncharacterized protein n=1 Tax=Winogradskyella litoriviva TaxID=1220182 RepID=A0ABX2E5E5_9FLAO|nr:hypothetical protein [Winogradskyella litoriviva]NRD23716.1 hypothetical protein [Winogradskyella litoriviva]